MKGDDDAPASAPVRTLDSAETSPPELALKLSLLSESRDAVSGSRFDTTTSARRGGGVDGSGASRSARSVESAFFASWMAERTSAAVSARGGGGSASVSEAGIVSTSAGLSVECTLRISSF